MHRSWYLRACIVAGLAGMISAACTPTALPADAAMGYPDRASPADHPVVDGDAATLDAPDASTTTRDAGDVDVDGAPADAAVADAAAASDSALWPDAAAADIASPDTATWPCLGDQDGDGYGPGADCPDRDCAPLAPAIHPGATELCDDVDNDCDGPVDENLSCPAPMPKIWIFILAGQSNMVGLGRVDELGANQDLFPATLLDGIPKVGIYLEDSVHNNPNQNGAMRWLDLRTYGGFGVDRDRFGPELGFGARMHELWPERQIRIIKVAEGASNLYKHWAARGGRLYDLLLDTVLGQLQVLGEHERTEVVGFLWMQGESDAYDDYAIAYGNNLRTFIGALREDLAQPQLPFTAALIAPQGGWPEADTVRAATETLSQVIGPMNVVETNDLPMWADDQAHYNTRSQLILGRRFADAIVELLPSAWDAQSDFSRASGDAQWSYRARASSGVVQSMQFDAAHQRWSGSETGCLIMPGQMHPGATLAAELTWRAPYGGRIQVAFEVHAVNNLGGDGTRVELADGDFVRWGPVHIAATSNAQHSLLLDVTQGRERMFRTAAGPGHDNNYDTTASNIDISMQEIDL